MVLVGNKTDDEGEGRRIVSEMDGRNLAERHNIPVIETSAVRNENVQEVFTTCHFVRIPHASHFFYTGFQYSCAQHHEEEGEVLFLCIYNYYV